MSYDRSVIKIREIRHDPLVYYYNEAWTTILIYFSNGRVLGCASIKLYRDNTRRSCLSVISLMAVVVSSSSSSLSSSFRKDDSCSPLNWTAPL